MVGKNESGPGNDRPATIEVELIGDHTHGGVQYKKGDKITVRPRQLERLREWGKVK